MTKLLGESFKTHHSPDFIKKFDGECQPDNAKLLQFIFLKSDPDV